MTDVRKPTKAMRPLLAWLVHMEALEISHRELVPARARKGQPITFRGGDLITYYSKKNRAEGRHTCGTHGGGYAQHGWRRAGGKALANLHDFGLAERVGISYGTWLYELTVAGREAGGEAQREGLAPF